VKGYIFNGKLVSFAIAMEKIRFDVVGLFHATRKASATKLPQYLKRKQAA
jgi:hypothetical protein